jgi:tetratricopeptide (TPR) repeat protein
MGDDCGLARARQLLELNQVDPAIAVLRDLLTVEPENANARAWLARAYLAGGRVELAIEHGQAALALDPDNHRAHRTLAYAYLRRGRMSHSRLWSETRSPGRVYFDIPIISALRMWSQIRAMKAARRAARPHVDFLLAASPDWAPYHRLKAAVESGQWQWRGRKTLDTLEAAVALDPEDAATWSAAAGSHVQRGNYVAAERAARQALALDPEDRSSLYLMGNAALRERRFDEARDNALSILRRWPKDAKGMNLLASAKMGEDRWLGIFFRVIATRMRLEQTRLGNLLLLVMTGIIIVLIAPWRGDDGLTSVRPGLGWAVGSILRRVEVSFTARVGVALLAAWLLLVLPAEYLKRLLIYRELLLARRKVKLRDDF